MRAGAVGQMKTAGAVGQMKGQGQGQMKRAGAVGRMTRAGVLGGIKALRTLLGARCLARWQDLGHLVHPDPLSIRRLQAPTHRPGHRSGPMHPMSQGRVGGARLVHEM